MKMKIAISKVLEGAMAQAVFDISQGDTKCWLKDCLMLQILRAENSKAYRILASLLKGWQIEQLKLRLERFAYRMGVDTSSPAEYYKAYALLLAEQYSKEKQLSTQHALIDILKDPTTLSSRLFALYNITAESIRRS